MSSRIRSVCCGALCLALSLSAMAREPGDEDGAPMKAELSPVELTGRYDNPLRRAETIEEYRNLPYEKQAYWGYEQLGLQPECIHEIRKGLDLVYNRKYAEARDHFETVDQRWPEASIGAAVQTVIWQALMLENFDYRYDEQYWMASELAREDLNAALARPGYEGWEHFLLAGIAGIEAIHTIRQERYLPALNLAFEAMDHAQKSREHAPEFVDLQLADGMYNYWRTVVTESSKVLPDFGDHRAEGIEQMKFVESHGIFMGAPTTLALTFTWMQERDLKRAMTMASRNARQYPDSVINNLLLGQIQTYTNRYENAHETWDRVLAAAPDNNRVHYWRAVTLLREKKPAEAEASARRYLASDHLESWQKSHALWRLGQSLFRQRKYPEAYASYKEAVKIDGHKGAKAAMDRMKQARKEGRIQF